MFVVFMLQLEKNLLQKTFNFFLFYFTHFESIHSIHFHLRFTVHPSSSVLSLTFFPVVPETRIRMRFFLRKLALVSVRRARLLLDVERIRRRTTRGSFPSYWICSNVIIGIQWGKCTFYRNAPITKQFIINVKK